MAKKAKPPVDLAIAKPKPDEELQNAVIEMLHTGHDDDGSAEGLVIVHVEEFLRVQRLIKDRTGDLYGDVDPENDTNFPDADEEEDDLLDDGDDDDDFEDDMDEDEEE